MFLIIRNPFWSNSDFPFFRIYEKDLQISYWRNEFRLHNISHLEKTNEQNNVFYRV